MSTPKDDQFIPRPDDAEAYLNSGNAYYEKGDYDRALADFNKAIELQPDLADAYNNRGLAYHIKRDYDRAIADLDKAHRMGGGLGWILRRLAPRSWQMGESTG